MKARCRNIFKMLVHFYIYISVNNIFHEIRAIPLVLAQLSENCPLIIETFKIQKKNLKCLIFVNLFKINLEKLCISRVYYCKHRINWNVNFIFIYYQKYSYLLTYLLTFPNYFFNLRNWRNESVNFWLCLVYVFIYTFS